VIVVIRYLGLFLLWNALLSVAVLFLPRVPALLAALALTGAYLWLLLNGAPHFPRQWSALRLRPLVGAALRWTLIGIPAALVFTWALGEVYVRLVPVPPEHFDPFRPLMGDPVGRLTITLLAIAIAPVLEEFVFRGLIQSSLERRWGALRALTATAFLFALVHFNPRIFPLYFVLGLIFGYGVYATRSIWAGVLLHAVNNTAAMVGIVLPQERVEIPTIWETGLTSEWWSSVATLLLTGAFLAHVARRLWSTRRGATLRPVVDSG
jgi:membrane protease YdiL (CAAX protease family)